MSSEKNHNNTIELLKKDYLLKTENKLNKKIGEIVQDFISRGLYNSTACIGKQLQAHFEHKDKLIDYIIESLEQDFSDIPLQHFKEKLLTTVDEEYKKLIPFSNSFLVNAGLAQQSTFKSFEQQINNKKKRAKQAIETKCAILKKQNGMLEPKPPEILQKILWVLKYGRKHWKLIILAIVLLFVWGNFIWPKFDFFSRFYHPAKKETLNDYGRTRLYARTKKRVDDIYENIENEKLNLWIFIKTGKMRQITKHDGRIISYKGFATEFSGF